MKNHQFNLIDSTYGVEDAKEVLASLITDKINFLNKKIFSEQVRFGSDTQHKENRVQILKMEQEQLLETLNALEDGARIGISCKVNMKIEELVVS